MAHLSDSQRSYRRTSLDSSRNINTLQSPFPAKASPTHLPVSGSVVQRNGSRQQLAELIAHLVIALSRYHRQLRAEGGRVPAQVDDLVGFLADCLRARDDVPMPYALHRASASSVMPRRLLITKRDAAEQLGISVRTIERLISAGRLPLVHVEGAARVRTADLEAYVRSLEANGD
jgi:excisionase family DNA binding protein